MFRLHDKSVITEVTRLLKEGAPYIGMFYRKVAPSESQVAPLARIRSLDDIYPIGTLGQVFRIIMSEDTDTAQAFVMGHRRIQATHIDPYTSVVDVTHHDEKRLKRRSHADPDLIKAYKLEIIATMKEIRSINPMFKEQLELFIHSTDINNPDKSGQLADIAAELTTASGDDLQGVLEAFDPADRLAKALLLLKKELELSRMQSDISKQVEEKLSKNQRTFLLHEQLKSIKKELGIEKGCSLTVFLSLSASRKTNRSCW